MPNVQSAILSSMTGVSKSYKKSEGLCQSETLNGGVVVSKAGEGGFLFCMVKKKKESNLLVKTVQSESHSAHLRKKVASVPYL